MAMLPLPDINPMEEMVDHDVGRAFLRSQSVGLQYDEII